MNYKSVKDDSVLVERLDALGSEHPREGFWKCYHRIRNTGQVVNHKRLHRVYKQMGLPLRRKNKKRLPARVKERIVIPDRFTHTWSIDFVSDTLENGRKFRSFNVIDDFNREVLFIEIDYSLKSSRVIWVLKHLAAKHGEPKRIRMDNGPDGAGLPVYCQFSTGMEHGQRDRVQIYLAGQTNPKCSDSRSGTERFNKSY